MSSNVSSSTRPTTTLSACATPVTTVKGSTDSLVEKTKQAGQKCVNTFTSSFISPPGGLIVPNGYNHLDIQQTQQQQPQQQPIHDSVTASASSVTASASAVNQVTHNNSGLIEDYTQDWASTNEVQVQGQVQGQVPDEYFRDLSWSEQMKKGETKIKENEERLRQLKEQLKDNPTDEWLENQVRTLEEAMTLVSTLSPDAILNRLHQDDLSKEERDELLKAYLSNNRFNEY